MREETTDGTIGEMIVGVATTVIGEMIGAVLIGEMIDTRVMTGTEEETIGMRGGMKGIETEVTIGTEEDMMIGTIGTIEGETIDVVDTRRRREMIETGGRDKGMEGKTREGEKMMREARRI